MAVLLSPLFNDAQLNNAGEPASGWLLYWYAAGTTTPQNTYTDDTGAVAQANPIVLNSRGEPDNAIWLSEGLSYKCILKTDAGVTVRTVDDITGVNDTSVTVDQWVASGLTPTYVSATSFTLSGDQTTNFHIGRALKTTNTGGTIYSLITNSSYGAPNTTVTVANMSGTLDSGLSAVSYGIITYTNTSLPGPRMNYAATTNPAQTNDATQGYDEGSFWYNTTGNWAFVCVDPTASNAIWRMIGTPQPNALDNGGFQVIQRGAGPFTAASTVLNNDDSYLLDRWILLSDGNDIVDVSQIATTTLKDQRSAFAVDLDVETNDKKFGQLQILSAARTKALYQQGNGKAALSFTACQAGGGITKIKAVVLAWSGTADAVTSDIVSAWGADGTTPTWIANVTAENTPSSIAPGTSPTRYYINDITLDTASTTNLMVFIWSDDLTTVAGTDHLYLSAIKIEPGPEASDYVEKEYENDLQNCLFYLWRPNSDSGDTSASLGAGAYTTTTAAMIYCQFPRMMRVTPSFSVSNVADFKVDSSTPANDTTNLVLAGASTWGASLTATTGAVADGDGARLTFDAAASKFMQFTAEL